jgi:hypothetical protein
MDGPSRGVRQFFRQFVLCGLCALGTIATGLSVRGQVAGASASVTPQIAAILDPPKCPESCTSVYSLDPKTLPISFQYTTKRNETSGVVSLVPAKSSPKLTVVFNGEPPRDPVLLVVQFTYNKQTGVKFTTSAATAFDAARGNFVIDLKTMAESVVNMINNRLTPSFDPNNRPDIFTLTEVKFSLIFIPPVDQRTGNPIPTDGYAVCVDDSRVKDTDKPVRITVDELIVVEPIPISKN